MLSPGQTVTFKTTLTQGDFDRFAALSGDDNPIHVDPEFSARTHFGRPVAHGMLLYGVICRGLGSLLPGPGTWHLAQELVFPSPTFAGEEITTKIEVVDIPEEGVVELSTMISRPNGEESCRGRAVISLEIPTAETLAHEHLVQNSDASKSEASQMKGLHLGQSAIIKRIFTSEDLAEHTRLTGDANPLYTDFNYARAIGLAAPLIPGPLLGGLFSTLLGTKLPGYGTNWLKQKLAFLSPVYPGLNHEHLEREITARVEVVRLRPDKDLVNLHTSCTVSHDNVVCDGEALVLVKDVSHEFSKE